ASGPGGVELWKSDGTEAGTVMVKDINPGTASSSPAQLIAFNGALYFAATSPATGSTLWRSDGTDAGTVVVKPGLVVSNPPQAGVRMTNVNGTLFFAGSDAATGTELWKTDGTAAGTTLVKDIVPGSGGITFSDPVNLNGTLFFRAATPDFGSE